MFKTRRRAASNPAQRNHTPAASSSASLAATKAFIRDRESNGALSSAAAAAALRTHVTTPTPVGETVTKRMIRKSSTSSQGSSSQNRPDLRRQGSTGSMTERSFRAPSPGAGGPVASSHHDAPPVPAVPKNVPETSVAQRRASSLEPRFRGGSPAGRGGGRGVSLDRGAAPTYTPGRGAPRVSSLQQVPEDADADGRRGSINFSRPISPSAPARPAKGGHTGWFAAPVADPTQGFRGGPPQRPMTSDGTGQYAAQNTQYSVQNAAAAPVKRNQMSQGVQGARLSSGSMRAKPSGTSVPSGPVDPKSPFAVYDPSTRTFVHKQDAMARHRQLEEAQEQPASSYMAQYTAPQRPQSPPQQQRQPRSEPVRDEPEPAPQRRSVRESSAPPASQIAPPLGRQTSEDLASADIRPPLEVNTGRNTTPATYAGGKQQPATTSPRTAPNQDSAYPRLGKPAETLATRTRDSARVERTPSLSPARHTHFAPATTELSNGVKHHPLPRSVSPAKSALKPSPPGSNRNASPVTRDGRIASWGPSEASDEGSTPRKKRTVRVSFEEQPEIAGISAAQDAETPTSPGLSQSRWNTDHDEHDLEDVMKPRPLLPSFGSIRDRNRRDADGDVPEKVTETVSSSMTTSVGSLKEPLETSNDHVVGGILAHDFESKQPSGSLDPLPPEVTSVEGSGYVSDTSSTSSGGEPIKPATVDLYKDKEPQTTLAEPKTLTQHVEKPAETHLPPPQIPAIAVQPASPSPMHEKPEPQYPHPRVPGGWDDDEPAPVKIDISASAVTWAPQAPRTIDEDSDTSEDNSSIYSDAYEEFDDDDDGGFASIDAVVASPMKSEPEPYKNSLQDDMGGAQKEPASASTDEWSAIQQHWSGMRDARKQSQQPKDNIGAKTTESVEAAKPIAMPADVSSRSSKAPSTRSAGQVSKPKQAVRNAQPVQSSQATPQPRKSAMKKTTPSPQPVQANRSPEPQMRKTMRGNAGPPQSGSPAPHMRSSMRSSMRDGFGSDAPRAQSGLAASRYSVAPSETKPPRGALQKRHIPAAGPAARARPQSAAGPVARPAASAPTYDSDSDGSASSFQRSRARGGRGANNRYTMRASMRDASAPTMRDTPIMKTVPPPRPASPPAASLRKSMRPSSPTPDPSAPKSSRFSIRSLSPAGRFRQSKTTPVDAPPTPVKPNKKAKAPEKRSKAKSAPKPMRSAFQSRFADSSDDEDDAPRSRFQSRFADSDDDSDSDLPSGLTPVRGIPRKAGDEDRDSTDLEDEVSDTEPAGASQDAEKNGALTNGIRSGEGSAFAATSLRKSKHAPELPSFDAGSKSKKRGFFGFGKKKNTNAEPVPTSQEATDSNSIPMPPPHRERDAEHEQNHALTPINEDKEFNIGTPPRSPKLQRRTTPQWGRSTSDSWPLPQPPAIGQDVRPQSSDGVPARRLSLRPSLSKRVSTQSAQTAIDPRTGRDVSVGRSGKKKKFQGLRRVFGLND